MPFEHGGKAQAQRALPGKQGFRGKPNVEAEAAERTLPAQTRS